jgi:RimJ/RimL family protein N-acetyltransferase
MNVSANYIYYRKYLPDCQSYNRIKFDHPYRHELIRPALFNPLPKEILNIDASFTAWSLIGALSAWRTRKLIYEVHVIKHNDNVVHVSVILPRYYRFPFMGPKDIECGPCWTHPDHRGKGLFTRMLKCILKEYSVINEYCWIFCEVSNIPSLKGIERAGFIRFGAGFRSQPLGIKILGKFVLNSELRKQHAR